MASAAHDHLIKPATLAEVAERADSLTDFGRELRDWQHVISRGVHSRSEFARRLAEEPRLLRRVFDGGDIADAYLAAYAQWLSDGAGIPRPDWTADRKRIARAPWFSDANRTLHLVRSPAAFVARNLFTIPENVFHPKAGRPRVPPFQKAAKAAERQRRYRRRVAELLRKARRLESLAPEKP